MGSNREKLSFLKGNNNYFDGSNNILLTVDLFFPRN